MSTNKTTVAQSKPAAPPEISDDNVKYRFTGKSTEIHGRKVWQIVAQSTMTDPITGMVIKKGTKGGFIEKEANLDAKGTAWVFEHCYVIDDARIVGDAAVCCHVEEVASPIFMTHWQNVREGCVISGNAVIGGDFRVYGVDIGLNVRIFGSGSMRRPIRRPSPSILIEEMRRA